MSFPYGEELLPFEENNKNKVKLIDIPVIETWKAMENLVEMLEKLLLSDIKIKPYANQVEQHLFLQEQALLDFCEKRNIILEGYRTLGGPASSRKPGKPILLENPILNEIAKEIGKTPAQVELKFLLSLSENSVVLAKSSNKERIGQNIDLDFDLSENQIQRLKSQDRCLRLTTSYESWGVDVFTDHW